MERRSAKRATARRKYTVDAFDGIEELQDARSDVEDRRLSRDDDDSADEFEAAALESPDEDEMSGPNDNIEDDVGAILLEETISIDEDLHDIMDANRTIPSTKITSANRKTLTARKNPRSSQMFSRGIPDTPAKSASKDVRRMLHFGPSARDHEPVYQARVRWAYDPTLPSRFTDKNGFGGMHRSFFVHDDFWTRQAKQQKEWWIDKGGKAAFAKDQLLETMSQDHARAYMPEYANDDQSFLMGPFKTQKAFHLGVGKSIPLQAAWSPDPPDHGCSAPQSTGYKGGFMLNLGAKVHCLAWAPDQGGHEQYLAAAVLPGAEKRNASAEAQRAPAFVPQPSHKSNVQVWQFYSSQEGSIDAESAPRLSTGLCTDWGDAKVLEWCPQRANNPELDNGEAVGFLAGIWSDGAVRLLHVPLPSAVKETTYIHISQAAFESRPPGTVCTCLTWISSTRLAAGCANGCIAVWDLPSSLNISSGNARPIVYSAISTSYILSIASCQPSRPEMLMTSSMGGHIALTDLRRSGQSLSSQASTVLGNRNRIGATCRNMA